MRLLLLAVILFYCSLSSDAQGIRFFEGSWQQLLDSARSSHQLIFVDVYTDWCGPCKRMEKEVFVRPEAAAFYQTHYICYRLNAEKKEGPRLSKAYGVSAYPTWLFLDEKGTLRSRRTDYMPVADFIAMGRSALGADAISDQLAAYERRFRSGERDTVFLRSYLTVRTSRQLDNAEILDAYVAKIMGRSPSPAVLHLLLQNAGRTWSTAIPLMAACMNELTPINKKAFAADLFSNTLYFAWGDAIRSHDSLIAGQAFTVAEKLYPWLDSAQRLTADNAAVFYGRTFRLPVPLTKAGYRLAAVQMAIDTNLLRRQDAELYAKVMASFRSGQQDSTKIPMEELHLAAHQASGKAAALLYDISKAFLETLPTGAAALHDAKRWAIRADQLTSNQHTRQLVQRFP